MRIYMDKEARGFRQGEQVSVDYEPPPMEIIDFDYEYDAPRFFDFTRPESPFEVDAAEGWFGSANNYPSSPFLVKLNFSIVDGETFSPKFMDDKVTCSSNSEGVASEASTQDENDTGHQALKPKSKTQHKPFLPRSSTLLKPTASHLAKQNTAGVCLTRLVGRRQQTRSPQTPSREANGAKRQKLEIGYLRRVAQLKHQMLFLHKSPKRVRLGDSNAPQAKPKVTIPKEPDLETANKVQKHRFRSNAQRESNARPNVGTFRARPLNREILEAPSLSQPKKSIPQLPEFQVFHLRTTERAQQPSDKVQMTTIQSTKCSTRSGSAVLKRTNSIIPKQENMDPVYRFKARTLNKKILSSKGDGVFRDKNHEATIPKVVNTVTEKSSRCGMKQAQFRGGGRATAGIGSHPTITR
ncbi:hypothetical protein Dimus_000392 [Dionaea muscipula]